MRLPSNDERQFLLTGRRNLKMARSAHAYVRGNTLKFYEWLDSADRLSLPEGPPVWICGDCHVGNLGPVANAKGRIAIQIRDLDQTVIGNPAHDLIRLGLSLATAARGSNLPGVTTARMIEQMIEGYEQAINNKDTLKTVDKPRAVSVVMKRSAQRSWRNLADERLEGIAPVIPLGKRFWPLSKEEKHAITELFKTPEVHRLATMLRSRNDEAKVKVLDAAYWMKGCSSLGRLRYAVLLRIADQFCLMDVKEAVQAIAPRYPNIKMPRSNGERVVQGALHVAPFLGERMLSARLLDRSVFLRELMPQDMKIEIEHLPQSEAMSVARFLAMVVGKAHARQMDDQTRRAWQSELRRNHSTTLDAPSWLWSSVVQLVAGHEAAYLDHCRRYAAKKAA